MVLVEPFAGTVAGGADNPTKSIAITAGIASVELICFSGTMTGGAGLLTVIAFRASMALALTVSCILALSAVTSAFTVGIVIQALLTVLGQGHIFKGVALVTKGCVDYVSMFIGLEGLATG